MCVVGLMICVFVYYCLISLINVMKAGRLVADLSILKHGGRRVSEDK